ncbi:MAG: hypothetical protein AAB428_00540 [Patescibacteria group bacterium]
MESPKERFEHEIKLVENAIESETGEHEIVKYLSPLVNSVAGDFINECVVKKKVSLKEGDREEFIKSGWTYLHLAIRKYKEHLDSISITDADISFNFSSYFTWFIRQGVSEKIQEYFKSSNGTAMSTDYRK